MFLKSLAAGQQQLQQRKLSTEQKARWHELREECMPDTAWLLASSSWSPGAEANACSASAAALHACRLLLRLPPPPQPTLLWLQSPPPFSPPPRPDDNTPPCPCSICASDRGSQGAAVAAAVSAARSAC